jgi:putative MFS transporter
MGTAGAMARLGGLVAPSLMALVVVGRAGVAIGLFAGLLVIAAHCGGGDRFGDAAGVDR